MFQFGSGSTRLHGGTAAISWRSNPSLFHAYVSLWGGLARWKYVECVSFCRDWLTLDFYGPKHDEIWKVTGRGGTLHFGADAGYLFHPRFVEVGPMLRVESFGAREKHVAVSMNVNFAVTF